MGLLYERIVACHQEKKVSTTASWCQHRGRNNVHTIRPYQPAPFDCVKVQIFLEGQKIWKKNLIISIWYYFVTSKKLGDFFSKICGLLRMSELYHQALHRLLLLFRLMNCSVTTKYVCTCTNGIYYLSSYL